MISAARFPYLSILAAAARARSRLGGSCASHSMQVLALVENEVPGVDGDHAADALEGKTHAKRDRPKVLGGDEDDERVARAAVRHAGGDQAERRRER